MNPMLWPVARNTERTLSCRLNLLASLTKLCCPQCQTQMKGRQALVRTQLVCYQGHKGCHSEDNWVLSQYILCATLHRGVTRPFSVGGHQLQTKLATNYRQMSQCLQIWCCKPGGPKAKLFFLWTIWASFDLTGFVPITTDDTTNHVHCTTIIPVEHDCVS